MSERKRKPDLAEKFKVEKENFKKVFLDKYFELWHGDGKLIIYDVDDYTDKNLNIWKEIDLNFISQVRDVRETRPKAGFCFCITNAGDQIFVQADSENVMNRWIDKLNAASRIIVPPVDSSNLKPPNVRNEVAGGVIVPVKEDGSGDENLTMPALSQPSIHSGYAVKQGGMRKNWKKRYFLLDKKGLHYYKDDQEKEPIKTITVDEIRKARIVSGEHHPHREFLFEVITESRTFNIQCETQNELTSWVSEINNLLDEQPKLSPEYFIQPMKKKKTISTSYSSNTGISDERHDTKKYTLQTAPQYLPKDSQYYADKTQPHYTSKPQQQQQCQQPPKRSSTEEETISSNAVWEDKPASSEGDRRSKVSLKGFSLKKNWSFW